MNEIIRWERVGVKNVIQQGEGYTGDSYLSEYINILHELPIFNFHLQGPVCLFLPLSN